jgi:hypothetical protein
MGPAPKWCSFLDNLTEELEANPNSNGKFESILSIARIVRLIKTLNLVYDDYKFVTKQELEQIGLDHLIGTNVLRAYMHGYFMDIRLYRKAKLIHEPFNFEEFKKRKIKEKLEKERENRVKIERKLPIVNTELAKRLIEDKEIVVNKKKPTTTNIMEDKRFSELFTDPNFQIDPNSEEFKLLNPVVQKANEKRLKKPKKLAQNDQVSNSESNYSTGNSFKKNNLHLRTQLKKEIQMMMITTRAATRVQAKAAQMMNINGNKTSKSNTDKYKRRKKSKNEKNDLLKRINQAIAINQRKKPIKPNNQDFSNLKMAWSIFHRRIIKTQVKKF